MQFLADLWVPILAGGVGVFVMSAIVWTALPHHKTEFAKLSNEAAVMETLRAGGVKPGLYAMPNFGADQKAMATPDAKAKFDQGPVAYLTVAPSGVPAMGPMMAKGVVAAILVSTFVAYVAWHTLPAGSGYLLVFRVTGTITFMTYSLGSASESIWFARPWKSFALQIVDALLYAGVAAGCFGWLWP